MIFKYEITSFKLGKKKCYLGRFFSFDVYLIRTHPELSFFRNILLNMGLAYITEQKHTGGK